MIGGNYSGTVTFDSNDVMTFNTVFNGAKVVEHWKRAKAD
jgi:hypothetical protein